MACRWSCTRPKTFAAAAVNPLEAAASCGLGGLTTMTLTAHWLHLRLGHPLAEVAVVESAADEDPALAEAEIVARQKAYAAEPLAVRFTRR